MFSIIYQCYVTCHTQWAWVTYGHTNRKDARLEPSLSTFRKIPLEWERLGIAVSQPDEENWKPSLALVVRRIVTPNPLFKSLSSGSSRSNPKVVGSNLTKVKFSLTRGDYTKFPLTRTNYPGDLMYRQYCLATSGTLNILKKIKVFVVWFCLLV